MVDLRPYLQTFFIAALMAMKHSRLAVFAGCWGALAGMTVLSAVVGASSSHLVRSLLPPPGRLCLKGPP